MGREVINFLQNKVIKSVGIDIGTSTTKFVISELTLGRVSSHFALPHFDIINRRITHLSEIISTPLKNNEEIDLKPLVAWLEKGYQSIDLSLSDIKTGAVIITGETAIKKNANALIHYLAERSGDFVVAVAGASLEAVLAGKGSGAFEHSKKNKRMIANIDIGGGTANVVFFQQGKVRDTITFRVGGKLIELNQDGVILTVSPSIKPWLIEKGFHIDNGSKLSFATIQEIASVLCIDMLDVLAGKKSVADLNTLIHSTSCTEIPIFEEVMITGGVGKLMLETPPKTVIEIAKFNDFGPIIAPELSKALTKYPYKVVAAEETSRATVIGAGMQSTKISGSTITVQPNLLPIRNIPVVKVSLSETDFENQIETAILIGKALYQENDPIPFAFGLSGLCYFSYSELKQIATIIKSKFVDFFPNAEVLVVICEYDMAKALGQLLRLQKNANYEVICIDQVNIEDGDYIDIGEPLYDSIVPVVVKTLTFS